MADLRIADAPEIDESEVQGGLKIPTGGFGNKAINMNTVASWVVKDKDLPSKDYVDDKFNQGNQGLSGHVANKNNPHEVTKEQVGLGNVDNTADADKPISNATSAALNLKADKTQLQGLATTTQLDEKADKSTTYTKTEVDGVFDDLYQSLEDNFVANGAALPYDPQVTYNDGAIVNDSGALKIVEGGNLEFAVKADGVRVCDSTLEVFAENQIIVNGHQLSKWGDTIDKIQQAIDELSNLGQITGQAQELIFEPNKIYRAHLIKLKPFVDLNLNGSTIKKTDYTGADENVPKWWRILVPDFPAFSDARSKSHRIVIKNGKLDGNYLGTNWTWNTYNQEQASLIYLSTQNQYMTDKNDRCKFLIENMKLNENCSDGLHIGTNVDVLIRNIEAFDCFRGGLTITGGNSIIAGVGFDGISARIDTEIDVPGFDDTWKTDVILDDVYVDRNGKKGNFLGGGDLGTSHGGNCFLTNIHLMTAPVTIRTNEKTNLKIKTATLAVNADTTSANNSYMRSCNDQLEDIIFILTEDNSFFRIIPTSAVTTDVLEKTVATVRKIKFRKINESIIAPQSCIKLESQRTSSLNYLDFDDLDTSAVDSTYAVELAAGGKVKVNNLRHNSLQAVRATFLTSSKVDLTIGSVINGQRTTALLSTTVSDTSGVDNELHFTKDCVLKSNELQIVGTGNAKFPIFTTQRTIFGDIPPTANLHAFQGDVYKLNKPVLGKPFEWVCTTTGKTGNVWRATKWLTGSFETTSLPTLTSFDMGVENFNTTLGNFVKWNGTAWI